jgi:hypothetical protein
MPGRVLTFFEFSDKSSNGEATEKDLQDVTSAASNFSDGFDDSTYDQPELKPNRPVNGSYETTPNSPTGFNPEQSDQMDIPEGEETDEDDDSEDKEEETDEDDDDEKDKAKGNPEESNESKRIVKSFTSYVNESRLKR